MDKDSRTNDKREMRRVDFKTFVTLFIDGKEVSIVESLDISLKGIFVKATGLKVGTECDISLALVGSSSELKIELHGKVARTTDSGAGIVFTMIDPDSFLHLLNIIAINTGDYDAVHQEFLKRIALR